MKGKTTLIAQPTGEVVSLDISSRTNGSSYLEEITKRKKTDLSNWKKKEDRLV